MLILIEVIGEEIEMGKYDKLAKESANRVDQELKSEMDEMLKINPAMFPNTADKEAIDELIKIVDKSTSRNELVTAVKVCGAKLTADGCKMLKDGFDVAKKILI